MVFATTEANMAQQELFCTIMEMHTAWDGGRADNI